MDHQTFFNKLFNMNFSCYYRKNIHTIIKMTSLNLPGDGELVDAKRPYIRETDSDYVKHSKMGGTKDLLEHHDTVKSGSAVPYVSKCDWYKYDNSEENGAMPVQKLHRDEPKPVVQDDGESAIDIRRRLQKKYQTSQAPFYTDDDSCWTRVDQNQGANTTKHGKIRRYPM